MRSVRRCAKLAQSNGASTGDGSIRGEDPQSGAISDDETTAAFEPDKAFALHLGQHARNRLDRQAEVIGHVLASHGQVSLLTRKAIGQAQQERRHFLGRGLSTEQQQRSTNTARRIGSHCFAECLASP